MNGKVCKGKLLLDSGASANFISGDFVVKHALDTRELKQPFKVRLADRTVLACSSVIDRAHIEIRGDKQYSGFHQLMVLPGLKQNDVVLGMTFLKRSSSIVDFETEEIRWKESVRRHAIERGNWRQKHTANISMTTDEPEINVIQDSQIHNIVPTPELHSMTHRTTQKVASPADTSLSHEVGSVTQRSSLDQILKHYEQRMSDYAGKLPPRREGFNHKSQDNVERPSVETSQTATHSSKASTGTRHEESDQ